eukprot:c23410_g1_i2 orf=120-494(+)
MVCHPFQLHSVYAASGKVAMAEEIVSICSTANSPTASASVFIYVTSTQHLPIETQLFLQVFLGAACAELPRHPNFHSTSPQRNSEIQTTKDNSSCTKVAMTKTNRERRIIMYICMNEENTKREP